MTTFSLNLEYNLQGGMCARIWQIRKTKEQQRQQQTKTNFSERVVVPSFVNKGMVLWLWLHLQKPTKYSKVGGGAGKRGKRRYSDEPPA